MSFTKQQNDYSQTFNYKQITKNCLKYPHFTIYINEYSLYTNATFKYSLAINFITYDYKIDFEQTSAKIKIRIRICGWAKSDTLPIPSSYI